MCPKCPMDDWVFGGTTQRPEMGLEESRRDAEGNNRKTAVAE